MLKITVVSEQISIPLPWFSCYNLDNAPLPFCFGCWHWILLIVFKFIRFLLLSCLLLILCLKTLSIVLSYLKALLKVFFWENFRFFVDQRLKGKGEEGSIFNLYLHFSQRQQIYRVLLWRRGVHMNPRHYVGLPLLMLTVWYRIA